VRLRTVSGGIHLARYRSFSIDIDLGMEFGRGKRIRFHRGEPFAGWDAGEPDPPEDADDDGDPDDTESMAR
jgi:hypothetical protein